MNTPWPLLLYRLVWVIGFLPILVLLLWRILRGKDTTDRWYERFGVASAPRAGVVATGGRLVWIHGASVGEAISVMPLIEKLNKQPDISVLMTTGTHTSATVVAKYFAEMPAPRRLHHQFFPIDFWPCVQAFHRHWQPDVCVFMESEFWPEHYVQAKPILLNARISDRSWPRYLKYRWFFGPILQSLTAAFAQRDVDATRLQALGAPNVQIAGNLKYDAPALSYKKLEYQKLARLLNGRQLLVFASTHAGEEDMAVTLHHQLIESFPHLVTVIVPRHPERGRQLAITYKMPQRSMDDAFPGSSSLYLADTLGELGLWYALAKRFGLVVVGGSLVPHGGHNPLEPLKAGAPTLVGPHMFNFRDMMPLLLEKNLIRDVADPYALYKTTKTYLNNKTMLAKLSKDIQTSVVAFAGATDTAYAYLLEVLD